MDAVYGEERSGIRIWRIGPEFLVKNLAIACKRLVYEYLYYDFNPGTVQLLGGTLLLGFGVLFGSITWWANARQGVLTPAGTIMLAGLPTILGFQLLLSFLNYDIAAIPRRPLLATRLSVDGLLGSYPRRRPGAARAASGASTGASTWPTARARARSPTSHSSASRGCTAGSPWPAPAPGPCSRLGAGTLNHLRYVPRGARSTTSSSISTNGWLYDGAAERPRIRHPRLPAARGGASAGGGSYDRVLSIATLEHIGDLPACLARSSTSLLSGDGRFVAGIPSEGGFLWWLGWRATTGLSYRLRYGLDYGVLMRHEHLQPRRGDPRPWCATSSPRSGAAASRCRG